MLNSLGFQQANNLKQHNIRAHGEKQFLCSECGKSFSAKSELKEHLLRHTGLKRFECAECPSRFISKSNHHYIK